MNTPTSASAQQQAQTIRAGAQQQMQGSAAAANPQQRAQSAGIDTSAARSSAQQRAQGYSGFGGQASQFEGLNQEFQNRQRGAAQSERFQNFQRSGGGGRRR